MSMTPNADLKEGVDYDLLPHEDDENAWVIRVKNGSFEGLLIQYFSISITDNPDGTCNLSYIADVLEGTVPETMETEYHQLTTNILHAIITGFLEDSPEAIKFEDENEESIPVDDCLTYFDSPNTEESAS